MNNLILINIPSPLYLVNVVFSFLEQVCMCVSLPVTYETNGLLCHPWLGNSDPLDVGPP